ncbi:unnamed protein product, partial [Rotaria magnacalcarata]
IYVSTIMDECDIEQLVTTMKEGIRNGTIHSDTLNTLWKKTFGYRRLFIRSHTTNEVLEKFPGYSYPCLMFEEVKMIENVDIENNVSKLLPRLFDKLPNNSLFIMDLLSIRIIKLLCKQFHQSVSHILVDNEPLVPTPCIKVSNEKFELYLDWQVVAETRNPTTALSLLLSLYNVFEVKFAKNNHTYRLLNDRIKKLQIQTTNTIAYVDKRATSELQLHPQTITTKTVHSPTRSNIEGEESSQSPQSMALIIDEQEEQLHDYSLIQIDEPEQIDVPIETIPPPPKHPVNEPTPNTKTKSNNSSGIKHTVLKDVNNSEASTAPVKSRKRKVASSSEAKKVSTRLAAKRSRKDVSSF